ncbi:MAG: exodeoxyribonuclease 7 large subunit [Litorilinea sp.]|nr:MAG: exodeoxyribonuclease 7 large subunit [Litorilinea sp.]
MNPITVSALTTHIVALFERDELLRDVQVTGEVSNWKRANSGHIYFSLKDQGASIAAVMWRGNAMAHSWLPREGDQIIAHGYVGVYPDRGVYQLYVNRIRPAGRGQLYARFEAVKRQLEAEGLFAQERKRPIPSWPCRLGVVTSPDAAALRDILRVLAARWPLVDVVVFPTLVQGGEAPAQIEAALATANRYHLEVEAIDTLILARGGGSIEDLWAFNEPQVAYAIAHSHLPVVTGIGHETDFTIADFVADLRMPTPSAAAAAVVPDRQEVWATLVNRRRHLDQLVNRALARWRDQTDQARLRLLRLHPSRQLDRQRQALDDRERRLHNAIWNRLRQLAERNHAAYQRLEALSPRRVLQRGYSIVHRQDGQVVVDPAMVPVGELLTVLAARGAYQVQRVENAPEAPDR